MMLDPVRQAKKIVLEAAHAQASGDDRLEEARYALNQAGLLLDLLFERQRQRGAQPPEGT